MSATVLLTSPLQSDALFRCPLVESHQETEEALNGPLTLFLQSS